MESLLPLLQECSLFLRLLKLDLDGIEFPEKRAERKIGTNGEPDIT